MSKIAFTEHRLIFTTKEKLLITLIKKFPIKKTKTIKTAYSVQQKIHQNLFKCKSNSGIKPNPSQTTPVQDNYK